jgi:hypothetical protein
MARQKVAEHIEIFGMVCPGFGVPAHVAKKLSADHLRWPAESKEDLQVLCPGCQNRKGRAR